MPKPRKNPSTPFTDTKDAGHWYEVTPTGEVIPRFGCGLREARVHQAAGGAGLLPSPTTLISAVLAKPELEVYKIRTSLEGALAVLRTDLNSFEPPPRELGESDGDYCRRSLGLLLPAPGNKEFHERAVTAGRQHMVQAQLFGQAAHAAVEAYFKTSSPPAPDAPCYPFYLELANWFGENVRKIHFCEARVFSRDGYAGTSDLGLELMDGRLVIGDLKTSGWKTIGEKAPSPLMKFAHPLQISSYRAAAGQCMDSIWKDAGGLILHLDSVKPRPVVPEHFTPAELGSHYEAFLGLQRVWQVRNEYTPKRDLLPELLAQKRIDHSFTTALDDAAAQLGAVEPSPALEIAS